MSGECCYYQNKEKGIEIIQLQASSLAYPRHNHASIYCFLFITEGEIAVKLDKEEKCYAKGSSLTLIPYEPHEITPITKTYSLLNICINKALMANLEVPIEKLILESFEAVQEVLLSEGLKQQLLEAIKLEREKERSFDVHKEVTRLRSYIETHFEEELSLDELSSKLHISKYHMIRLFKEYVGLTPHRFQLQNRIRLAQRLIEEEEALTDVAIETGFYDQSHFIKQFKKIVGVTPHEYSGLYKKI